MENGEGIRLQRLPEDVIKSMSEHGQKLILSPVANVEIRFLLEGDSFEITLFSDTKGLSMHVSWGDFPEKGSYEIGEKPTTIRVTKQEKIKHLNHDKYNDSEFSHNLIRVMFSGDYNLPVYFHDIDGEGISLPSTEDTPDRLMLSYGTSITHGAGCTTPYLTYPYQAARQLGMDLVNLGVSGGAFCEKSVADHIASRSDWDIATISISVNMYNNPNYSFGEFARRAEYMIKTISNVHPNKPIFCITMFPFFEDMGIYSEKSDKNPEAHRQVIRDIVKEISSNNVFVLEGKDLLTDITLLSPDLLHPTDLGMIEIGRNLASCIEQTLRRT